MILFTFVYSTHIAAIKSTGNVFSYEAIEELNIKPKSFRDLLTDEPYQRKDLIMLQDPQNQTKFNLNAFHHIKNSLKLDNDELERAKTDPKARLKKMNLETKEALAELEKTYKPSEVEINPEVKKEKADKWNAAGFSTGTLGFVYIFCLQLILFAIDFVCNWILFKLDFVNK